MYSLSTTATWPWDLYSPLRSRGTLRCYYGHTLTGDPYRHIGEQDITAHVDFTSLMASGEESGLHALGLVSQRSFLYNLGFQELLDSMSRMKLDQRRRDAKPHGDAGPRQARRDGRISRRWPRLRACPKTCASLAFQTEVSQVRADASRLRRSYPRSIWSL